MRRSIKIKSVKLIAAFVVVATMGVAQANTTQENITLSRISSILNAVYPLIAKAQQEADPNTRVTFQYAWLAKDIQSIQAGIAQKINAAQIEPRVVPALNTQYVQQKNSHE
jgi:RAQPRD family integrative conjugative element protein